MQLQNKKEDRRQRTPRLNFPAGTLFNWVKRTEVRTLDGWLDVLLSQYLCVAGLYLFNLRKSACPVEFPIARDYSSGA